jgi:hypothetical protein
MEDSMKRIIIAAALLLGTATAVAAQAPPQTMYKDLIRPNGQKRSAGVYQADVDACYRQTGGSPYYPDSAAMKKCMLSHGYRFMWQRGFASSSARAAPSGVFDSGPTPGPTTDPSPPAAGPDTAGMNTPTNPTWPGFNQ